MMPSNPFEVQNDQKETWELKGTPQYHAPPK